MKGLAIPLAGAVLSAVYWLSCLHLATGLFMGDRITANGIVAPATAIPPWLFALLAIAVYAALSLGWDRLTTARR